MEDFQSVVNTDKLTYIATLNRYLDEALRERCDLSRMRYRTLAHLASSADPLTASSLARLFGASDAAVSQSTKILRQANLIVSERDPHSALKRLTITEQGRQVVSEADGVIQAVQEEYFSVLDDELRNHVVIGSYLTLSSRDTATRMHDGAFFNSYAVFEAFLQPEMQYTISAKKFGLTLTKARILVYLHELRQQRGSSGDATPLAISRRLVLSPAAIASQLDGLASRGCLSAHGDALDKRSYRVEPTDKGRAKALLFIDDSYRRITESLRATTPEERKRYSRAATTIANHLASAPSRRKGL